ncbi:MAG TPA: DUF5666 domain-containing protein [Steroidobacteraceae bacterium]|nr:DUF5666 domain-containing protein [Steroidobacteraceae bacterium]
MTRQHLMKALFIVAAALGLAACSGGGGSSGDNAPRSAAQSVPVISSGAVTGFGSVFVNGVRFETSSAAFTINGKPGTQADLRVGDVVKIHGHRDGAGNCTADRIDFDDLVKGPVTSVDAAAGTLVVLGQTVLVDADTSFDDNIPGASLAGLAAGDIVEVSGMRRADGDIQATRIEAKPAGKIFEVTGVASAVDTAVHKLNVTALVVDYSAAAVQNFPTGQPRNGDLIEARGNSVNAGGDLVASTIELKRDDDDRDAGMEVEIEGLITRFVSVSDFDIAGKPVTTTSTTRFENGTAADLALNVKVEAEGQVNASGVLVATKVQFKRQASARIEARVDSVDRAANKLVVLGIDVTVNANTRVEDNSDQRVTNFNLSNVTAGDFVEVRGAELPADSNDVVASRLERRRAESEVRLRGIVDTATSPSFTILGVTIQTTAGTEFEDTTADDFFADAVGRIAEVKGTVSGGVFTARAVEFEND